MENTFKEQPAARPDGTVALPDMCGAAFLLAAGHRVLGIEPSGIRRMVFVFEDSARFRADYLRFLNNEPIGAQDFISGVYRLKRLLHELRDGGRR